MSPSISAAVYVVLCTMGCVVWPQVIGYYDELCEGVSLLGLQPMFH
jgi:hypothetical protein